jgi:serine/threonine-protein kinase Chk1
MKPKQLNTEIMLHSHLGRHKNVIQFLATGEDPHWRWIAMELAEGGDLFDKIESDVGVGEEIAHFYFTQLINAVSYLHEKGVAHRDLKPENILVSAEGNLKVADFGLAGLFKHDGKNRLSKSMVGSPPYIAPEIPEVAGGQRGVAGVAGVTGYEMNIADIWSCGIILFVLLVGNTPWDEPTMRSYEFKEYVVAEGRGNPEDELWAKISPGGLSLIHGMLKLDPSHRFALNEIRTHPWFTQRNKHLNAAGLAADPINLATQMMERLHINFDAPPPSQRRRDPNRIGMDLDTANPLDALKLSATQPEAPMVESPFNWERPRGLYDGVSASQPTAYGGAGFQKAGFGTQISSDLRESLINDISLSQFAPTPAVPLSLTQAARRFGDIVPAHALTRFLSALPMGLLTDFVNDALHRMGIPSSPVLNSDSAYIQIASIDARGQGLKGTAVIEQYNQEIMEVRFVKAKGDPVGWRRLFKSVCIHCKDAILVPQ